MRKSWAFKAVLFLSAALLLVIIGAGYWVTSVRDRKWAAMLARIEELEAELRTPAPERLIFERDPLPGNAWDDYTAANPDFPGQPSPMIAGRLGPFLERKAGVDRAMVDGLLSRYSDSIDLVASGAKRREARHPGREMNLYGYGSTDVSTLCSARARVLAEAGRTSDAIDLLTAVCVYGRDIASTRLASHGTSGIYVMTAAFRELRDLIQTRDLPTRDLLELERRLQLLDDHFPDPSDDLRNDLLELGKLLLREEQDDEIQHHIGGVERTRRSWRFFYSNRLQAATAFFDADRLVRKGMEARKLPWAQEELIAQELWREREKTREPIVQSRISHLLDNQTACQARADLRLLRFVVHYLATGETLEIEDPFGTTIRSVCTEKTLLAWHRAMFGTDDWQPKSGPTAYTVTLTIEVPRRRP
jgi:hypothetical protein